jgi:predicted nucleotidyltransferase
MISDRDKATVTALARRYGVARVWLFGSSANGRKRRRDLDLAVEGMAPTLFFQFLGELMMSLSRPVDLVFLEKRSKLSALIRSEGVPIYGKPVRKG